MGFTFCPKGRGVSRIDYVWANEPATRRSSAEQPARAAVATRAGPLSADHVPRGGCKVDGLLPMGSRARHGKWAAEGSGDWPSGAPQAKSHGGGTAGPIPRSDDGQRGVLGPGYGRAFIDEVWEWPAVARAR